MIEVRGNVVDISEMLEMGETIETYFRKNGISEAEWPIVEKAARGVDVIPSALILAMIAEGEIEAFIDPETGEIMLQRTPVMRRMWAKLKKLLAR